MHADTLYHRMLDQEQAIETAKAEGKPIPTFPPILSSGKAAAPSAVPPPKDADGMKVTDLPTNVQSALKERLEGLNDEEKRLEEQAIKAEIRAGEQVAANLEAIYKQREEERRIRKEQGKETIGDRLSSVFGFR